MRLFFLIFIISLISCKSRLNRPSQTSFIIPQNYDGRATVFFDVHGMEEILTKYNMNMIPLNNEGFALTSTLFDSNYFKSYYVLEMDINKGKDVKHIFSSEYILGVLNGDSSHIFFPKIGTTEYLPKEGRKLNYFTFYVSNEKTTIKDSLMVRKAIDSEKKIAAIINMVKSRK